MVTLTAATATATALPAGDGIGQCGCITFHDVVVQTDYLLPATRDGVDIAVRLAKVATTPLDAQLFVEVGGCDHNTGLDHDLADRHINPLYQIPNLGQLGRGIGDDDGVGPFVNHHRAPLGYQGTAFLRACREQLYHVGGFGVADADKLRLQRCQLGNLLVGLDLLTLPLGNLLSGSHHQHIANGPTIQALGL